MDMHEWVYLLVGVLLLIVSGFFSASEIAILSVNRFRLHQLTEGGSARARLLQRLLQQPGRLLTAILVLITSVNFANEALVTYWLVVERGLPEWIPFVTVLVLVLILAEVTPISYAAANPEIVATAAAPLVDRAVAILRPLIAVLTTIPTGLLRLFGAEVRPRPVVTGEEVLAIVDMETERGVLEEEEKELIHSIFEFSHTVVREIMLPRIDIIAVEANQTVDTAIDLIIAHRFSRLPVYQGSLDHIIGLVHVKDLLPFQIRRDTGVAVYQVLRSVTFVPETKHVAELLQEFRESKQTLAIVLDEYGGTAGMVTVEDLLEEIVGEIYDEYDVEPQLIEWLDADTVVVSGKLSVEEVGALIQRDLPPGEYDTVGGLLYSRFGDVPARGESVVINDVVCTVDQLDGHRITKVRLHRLPFAEPAPEDEE